MYPACYRPGDISVMLLRADIFRETAGGRQTKKEIAAILSLDRRQTEGGAEAVREVGAIAGRQMAWHFRGRDADDGE